MVDQSVHLISSNALSSSAKVCTQQLLSGYTGLTQQIINASGWNIINEWSRSFSCLIPQVEWDDNNEIVSRCSAAIQLHSKVLLLLTQGQCDVIITKDSGATSA